MGKSITVSVPHKLTRDQARLKVMEGIAGHKQRFANVAQVEDTWTGDHLDFKATAMGQSLTGRLDVTDEAVVVNIDLPWMLAMMSGRIKGELETEGRKLLESK